jgi:hypothetical protein
MPAGLSAMFCPHCGQNLTVTQCPACSAEPEIGWKFCPTCGRKTDDPGLDVEGEVEGVGEHEGEGKGSATA